MLQWGFINAGLLWYAKGSMPSFMIIMINFNMVSAWDSNVYKSGIFRDLVARVAEF